jgi:hypothetical protein
VRAPALLLLLPLLLWSQPALAQTISVRLVTVRGQGQLQEGQEPRIGQGLGGLGPHLRNLGMASYTLVADQSKQLRLGEQTTFALPMEHEAELSVVARDDDRMQVNVEVTRPGAEVPEGPQPPRRRVVYSEVSVLPAQAFMVRCVELYGSDDDLLIVISLED